MGSPYPLARAADAVTAGRLDAMSGGAAAADDTRPPDAQAGGQEAGVKVLAKPIVPTYGAEVVSAGLAALAERATV